MFINLILIVGPNGTNMLQINVCHQLYRATVSKARLMFVTNLEMDNFLHPDFYTLASVHAWVHKYTLENCTPLICFPLVVRLGSKKKKRRAHHIFIINALLGADANRKLVKSAIIQ